MTIGNDPLGKLGTDVFIQDSTSPLFQYFFMRELKTDIALTSPVSIGDEVIDVSPGHGFTGVAGEQIVLFENNRYLQLAVTNVVGDAISIEEPSTVEYSIAGAVVVRGNILMNVDGSGGDINFDVTLRRFDVPVDISQVIITMQHGANVPDDGKFGGLAALTNGIYFHKHDGAIFSMGNYTSNQAFKDTGGIVEYTDKAPAGTNATNIAFDIKKVFGQVIRLDPRTNDFLRGTVRDNIDAGEGMAKLTASLIGSYTVGE